MRDLKAGDRVDLEGDMYANEYVQYEFAYAVVDELEYETEACVVVHFADATIAFPPSHQLRVAID